VEGLTIRTGQVWRSNETGEDWVVTRTYSEMFSTYAVLRRAGDATWDADLLRVKLEESGGGLTLPGFTLIGAV
jgi:hypothetical protein